MDDYLVMILRDHGLWAGFVMGLYFYLKWINNPSFKCALLWQGSFIFGGLFRPECLIFNILLPYLTFISFPKIREFRYFIQSSSLILLFCFSIIVLALLSIINFSSLEVGRLNEFLSRPLSFFSNLSKPLNIQSENYYLKVLLADFSLSFKFLFLTYILLYKWIAGVGILNLTFFVTCLYHRLIKENNLTILIIFFVLTALINIINFYATHVIANRYWVINWWIVYLLSTFGFYFIWQYSKKIKSSRKNILRLSIIILFSIYLLNVIFDKSVTHFEKNAGNWVKANKIDINNIYFNERRTAFYSGTFLFEPIDLVYATEIIQYKYLMIRYNRFEEIKPINNYSAIEYFPTKDAPKVIVYKRTIND